MAETIAARLSGLGVQGPLVTAAEEGRITELVCAMDECLCPKGRGHFEPRTEPLTDWALNEDHFPTLKMNDGPRTFENLRLAHVLCNRVDFARSNKKKHAKDRNKALEGAIKEHPKVLDAVVITAKRGRSNEHPAAAVVAKPGEELTGDDITDFLQARGTNPRLPDQVVFLDEIPRTTEGRIAKRELRDTFDGSWSQRVTANDLKRGQVRFPSQAKVHFPPSKGEIEVVFRGLRLTGPYDPRTGPDRERSGVLLLGKDTLAGVREGEQLRLGRNSEGSVTLR